MNAALPVDADLERLVAVLDRHERLALAVSGGVDSMTLAHVAWRFSRARVHDVSRNGARGPCGGACARRSPRPAPRLAARPARRGRAGRCPLPREPGESLLLLQDPTCMREFAKSRRIPSPPARTATICPTSARDCAPRPSMASFTLTSTPPSTRPPCTRLPRSSGSTTSSGCRRSRASRAGSRPASRLQRDDLAFIDDVEMRLAAQLGCDAVVRCRVTHAGVVIEVAEAAGALACRCRAASRRRRVSRCGPDFRRRPTVPPRGGIRPPEGSGRR